MRWQEEMFLLLIRESDLLHDVPASTIAKQKVSDHFVGVSKMVDVGSVGKSETNIV
jgi:hypothetical protein